MFQCVLQRALCEAYGIVINVITSDQQNWFMRYAPEVQPKNNMEVFVTYIAPIHYNAVRCVLDMNYFKSTAWCSVMQSVTCLKVQCMAA